MDTESTQELNNLKNILEELKNQLHKDGKISKEDLGEYKARLQKAWEQVKNIPNQSNKR